MGTKKTFDTLINVLCLAFILPIAVAWTGTGICAQRPASPAAWPVSEEVKEVGKQNNDFAWSMYTQLKKEQGNLFFSPYSLRTALSMTYAGSKGETATQMERALHFTSRDEKMHEAFAQVAKNLKPGTGGDYKLTVANSLWGQKGYKWLDPFLNITKTYYEGGLYEVDFAGAPEQARKTINAWVEDRTNRKIKDLIPRNSRLTRLALVNAIWFKGVWLNEFDKAGTTDQPFYLDASKKVTAPLMHRNDKYRYAETDSIQMLELPYRGNKLSMVVALPKDKNGLADLEAKLTPKTIESWMDKIKSSRWREVDVYLPNFRMDWGTKEMTESFKALGMTNPFTPEADFSGMNGIAPPSQEAFRIGSIFHKAFVDVNETGTEAAAATAVVMLEGSAMRLEPPQVFRADHPFIFFIRDMSSGSILFIGRLVNPTMQK